MKRSHINSSYYQNHQKGPHRSHRESYRGQAYSEDPSGRARRSEPQFHSGPRRNYESDDESSERQAHGRGSERPRRSDESARYGRQDDRQNRMSEAGWRRERSPQPQRGSRRYAGHSNDQDYFSSKSGGGRGRFQSQYEDQDQDPVEGRRYRSYEGSYDYDKPDTDDPYHFRPRFRSEEDSWEEDLDMNDAYEYHIEDDDADDRDSLDDRTYGLHSRDPRSSRYEDRSPSRDDYDREDRPSPPFRHYR